MQVKILSIMISSFFLIGASSCDKMPEHNPSLLQLSENRVLKHNLVDEKNLKYRADSFQPLSYVDGGYCFPAGQLEAVLDHIRNNRCDKAKEILEH
jgi:hypothetical protein